MPSPAPSGQARRETRSGTRPGSLTRKAELKRGAPLSRASPPKRSAPLKRRHRRLSAGERREKQRFQEHAATQKRCANCKSTGAWHAHHAGVYEQTLKRLGLPLSDPANALRLCLACHAKHHSPNHKLPLSVLRAQNIRYAIDVLGEHAYDYLCRRYRGRDPRLERELERSRRRGKHPPRSHGPDRCPPTRAAAEPHRAGSTSTAGRLTNKSARARVQPPARETESRTPVGR